MWFRLASHLKKTLQEVQAGTTSTEFAQWTAFLEMEGDLPTTDQHYFAQMAAEVRRSVAKYPERIHHEHFLFKRVPVDSVVEQKSIEQHTKESQSFWCGALGMKPPS